jgi:hypothetical protein
VLACSGGIILRHSGTSSIPASKRGGDQWKEEKGRVIASEVDLVKPRASGTVGPEEDEESWSSTAQGQVRPLPFSIASGRRWLDSLLRLSN